MSKAEVGLVKGKPRSHQRKRLCPVGFPIVDGVRAGGSRVLFGDNKHNPLEIWAGLKDGGYTSCC